MKQDTNTSPNYVGVRFKKSKDNNNTIYTITNQKEYHGYVEIDGEQRFPIRFFELFISDGTYVIVSYNEVVKQEYNIDNKSILRVNKIKPQLVQCFNELGNPLGLLNEFEFNDLLIQCKENKLGRFKIAEYNGEDIYHDSEGRVYNQPQGFFDTIQNQLGELLGF